MGIIFTSLCKNLVKLTWVLADSAKTQVSLTRFLQSEVKIIHIIVQDQDGQNNNNTMGPYVEKFINKKDI